MKRFLITGLPRCRSAWLSALMTAHEAPCVHEIEAAGFRSLGDVFTHGFVGVSDPSIYFRRPAEVAEHFAGCPTAVIERDSEVSRASLERFIGLPTPNWPQLVESLGAFKRAFNPLIVKFEDLDDPQAVHRLVEHLTGAPLDRRIFRALTGLRIEQHIPKALKAVVS